MEEDKRSKSRRVRECRAKAEEQENDLGWKGLEDEVAGGRGNRRK